MDLTAVEQAVIGRSVSEVETPTLIIDADLLEQNIQRMADFFRDRPSKLRPHAKTHKSPVIGRMQVEAGAIGLTCAKVGEAEVMVNAGLSSLLIANQVVGRSKALRLARMCAKADVMAAVDNLENVKQISDAALEIGSTISLVIEVDVGMSRAGTRTVAQSLALAKAISELHNLKFRGFMGYEGHAVFKPMPDREQAAAEANRILLEHADAVRAAGYEVEIVSAGGTGTYALSGSRPGITEIEAGSYVTMDARYKGVIPEFENALTLLAMVVSRPSPERAVLDCGLKAVTGEFGMPVMRDLADAKILHLSEEHAKVELEGAASRELKVGDKVHVIPSHGCTTINLHDYYVVQRKGVVEAVWPIEGRGKVR